MTQNIKGTIRVDGNLVVGAWFDAIDRPDTVEVSESEVKSILNFNSEGTWRYEDETLSFVAQPDLRTLDEIKTEYLNGLDQEHAAILRTLTGNATIEERDTWQGKSLAAEAFENGSASTSQTEMLTTEASMSGSTIEELVSRILTNSANFMKMVGIASGHRAATKNAIIGAVDLEALEVVVSDARETANTLIADYLSATQGS